MRISQLRQTTTGATLTIGVLLATVGVAISQTQPAAALDSAGVPLESYAWFIPAGATTPALPSRPIAATSSPDDISALQTRLAWTGLPVTWESGVFDAATVAAVKGFQSRQQLKPTGRVDVATLARLKVVAGTGELDPRCLGKGLTLCVDKTQLVTRYVVDGKTIRVFNSQFGPEKGNKDFKKYSRTREGVFKIQEKLRNAVSNLYGFEMPFWMQFDGGEGFHYSGYFHDAGFSVTSYGCIISDNKANSAWLFDHTPKGTKVVVYH